MMVRIPTHRAPTHLGEMLRDECLNPTGLTQRELADGIHVPYHRVHELVSGRRGVTPHTALRLAKFLGTSPDVWMNVELRWDLRHAQRGEAPELDRIRRVLRDPPRFHRGSASTWGAGARGRTAGGL